jgi:hypothetical protein
MANFILTSPTKGPSLDSDFLYDEKPNYYEVMEQDWAQYIDSNVRVAKTSISELWSSLKPLPLKLQRRNLQIKMVRYNEQFCNITIGVLKGKSTLSV